MHSLFATLFQKNRKQIIIIITKGRKDFLQKKFLKKSFCVDACHVKTSDVHKKYFGVYHGHVKVNIK
ncbi:MAG: hypothetical protein COX80_01940 [Candidatus Magasanikbacteria bacterium CG_4_10_14_0_2_um_filter_33_14]|uniref:Uncharacterized protein n=1 Tax=Candidatus Magasanikbacteria bacterium CG_4_10_14_0_2_um_filter_33_14 TaxID=1974636 RepID=A0A2M7VB26_9BACT|nr:MAG: hypothetical protein COX80_01940 [Candidatus Magasanikbacteria bacterium CG_4_10_14_0_2_um_filter_33_14]